MNLLLKNLRIIRNKVLLIINLDLNKLIVYKKTILIWINVGIILFVVSLLLFMMFYFDIFIFTENLLLIIILIELCVLIITIFLVENKIKNL